MITQQYRMLLSIHGDNIGTTNTVCTLLSGSGM